MREEALRGWPVKTLAIITAVTALAICYSLFSNKQAPEWEAPARAFVAPAEAQAISGEARQFEQLNGFVRDRRPELSFSYSFERVEQEEIEAMFGSSAQKRGWAFQCEPYANAAEEPTDGLNYWHTVCRYGEDELNGYVQLRKRGGQVDVMGSVGLRGPLR